MFWEALGRLWGVLGAFVELWGGCGGLMGDSLAASGRQDGRVRTFRGAILRPKLIKN